MLWNTMMVAREFCEYMDGGAGRSIMAQKANPFAEYVSIPVRIKLCLLHNRRSQCIQPPTRWLAGPRRNGAIFGAQWYLLLAD